MQSSLKIDQYLKLLSDITGLISFNNEQVKQAIQDSYLEAGSSVNLTLISINTKPVTALFNQLIKKAKIQTLLPLEKYRHVIAANHASILRITVDARDKGHAPSEAIRQLTHGKRGLTLVEGLWFVCLNPEILRNQAIDLIGSIYSQECTPTIYKWGSTINLSAICPDVQDIMCGAPVVTKETILSKSDMAHPNVLVGKIRSLNDT